MKFTELNENIEFERYEIMSTYLSEIQEEEKMEVIKMKAINIIWDVDFEEELEGLPTEIEIPDGMEDEEEISDYLSDVTGFCHWGFELVSK